MGTSVRRRQKREYKPLGFRNPDDLHVVALDFFGLQQTLRLERYLDGLTDPFRRYDGIGVWNQSLLLAQLFTLGFVVYAAMFLLLPQPENPVPAVTENPLALLK